jgi:hypothetical protein
MPFAHFEALRRGGKLVVLAELIAKRSCGWLTGRFRLGSGGWPEKKGLWHRQRQEERKEERREKKG